MFKKLIISKSLINYKHIFNNNNLNKIFFTTTATTTTTTTTTTTIKNEDENENVDLKLKLYREKKIKKQNFINMVETNELQKIIKNSQENLNNKNNNINNNINNEESKIIKEKVDYNFKVEISPGIFITPALSKSDKSSVIVTSSRGFDEEAIRIAKELDLEFLDLMQVLRIPDQLFSYQSALFVSEKGVSLHDFEATKTSRNSNVRKLTSEIHLDYTSGAVNHRIEYGKNRKSPMIRSIKINNKFPEHVMDVTGGLGKDAWVIASMGCRVTIVERNPVLIYMMEKALEKAKANSETSEIASRITLIHKDSIQYLVENIHCDENEKPDVIYMDPMYPGKKKEKSLSKKDIRAVRRLVGGDRDSTLLFALSRRFTRTKVVWKRPKEVVPLVGSNSEYKSSDTIFYSYLKKDLIKEKEKENIDGDIDN